MLIFAPPLTPFAIRDVLPKDAKPLLSHNERMANSLPLIFDLILLIFEYLYNNIINLSI